MLAAPARWPWAVSAPDRPGPAAVAVEHHPDVLGDGPCGMRAEHARLVGGVQDASDAFFPLATPRCCRHRALTSNKMNEAVRPASRADRPCHRPGGRRDGRGDQAAAARLAAPRLRAAHARGRHRADRALADRADAVGSAVYAASALLLFSVSAVYHRGHWSPRMHGFLRRFDHANIFLLIAGSYTPFALVLLEGAQRVVAAQHRLVGGRARRAVQGLLDRCAQVALHADLHRHGLGRGVLPPGLHRGLRPPRRRDRHRRPRADRRPAERSTRSAASSTASSGPTRGRTGSASTRSSTRLRSWRSSPTTSASRWRRTRCA